MENRLVAARMEGEGVWWRGDFGLSRSRLWHLEGRSNEVLLHFFSAPWSEPTPFWHLRQYVNSSQRIILGFPVETVTSLAILEGPFLLSLTENSENNTCIRTFLRHPIYSDYGDMSLPLEGIFFFFFGFLLFLWAALMAYGGSQARGPIGAVATGLRQSHSNAGSQPCLQPTPQLMATPDC